MNPTQVAHPWRASIRTAIQTGLAAVVALVAILPVVQDFVAEVAPGSPVIAWIAGATVALSSLALAVTRIMALAPVNDFLTRVGIGPVSKDEA